MEFSKGKEERILKGIAMDRIIRITGQGSLRLKPDTTELIMTINDKCSSYEEIMALSEKKSGAVKNALVKIGFKRDNIKTESFNVNTVYESYNDGNGNYRQRFAGYEFYHNLKLTFSCDNDKLSEALNALADSEANPEFRIEYTVEDKTRAGKKLLEEAVKDSKSKAELMCKTLGVELGDVVNIDYSWGRMDMSVRPVNLKMDCATSVKTAFRMDVDPEDIELQDNVTVSWRIR